MWLRKSDCITCDALLVTFVQHPGHAVVQLALDVAASLASCTA